MAGRRVQPEVQKIFEKYVQSSVPVRRLSHQEALRMLRTEYCLPETHARSVLMYFDADQNGSLSLWEFQHFYNLTGNRVSEMASEFEKLDVNGQGFLSHQTAVETLSGMTSADGQPLEEKDIEMILKTAKDEDKIHLGDYIAVLYRLRMYRKGTKK